MNTCVSGKVSYPSPQAAHRTIRLLTSHTRKLRGKREKHRGAGLLNAYRCGRCNGWHVGHCS